MMFAPMRPSDTSMASLCTGGARTPATRRLGERVRRPGLHCPGMEQGLYTLLGAVIAGAIALIGIRVREQRLDRDRFTERKQALYTDLWTECDRHQRQVAAQVAWTQDLARRAAARKNT